MALDNKQGSRLIDRAVRALRRAGLLDDYSASGFDGKGPFVVVRDSPKAREVLQPVRQSGLQVRWGEMRLVSQPGAPRRLDSDEG